MPPQRRVDSFRKTVSSSSVDQRAMSADHDERAKSEEEAMLNGIRQHSRSSSWANITSMRATSTPNLPVRSKSRVRGSAGQGEGEVHARAL